MLAVLLGPRPVAAASTLKRYRADAVILLVGIPIFKRSGVGTGQVSVEESGEGPQAARTLFSQPAQIPSEPTASPVSAGCARLHAPPRPSILA